MSVLRRKLRDLRAFPRLRDLRARPPRRPYAAWVIRIRREVLQKTGDRLRGLSPADGVAFERRARRMRVRPLRAPWRRARWT